MFLKSFISLGNY